ncbi:hypothetical protein ANN_26507 [Periplaneta americana]|uniref:Uncharacterized protein n=1 Tax=Periplaneta americana TaxID=6978 RepID=A0ABQ8RYI6_PERAM|nr:hypothetical protein ANN_26507 [Periplaneta americana]
MAGLCEGGNKPPSSLIASKHHAIRTKLVDALRKLRYTVYEEVHGTADNGSNRRIDIIAISESLSQSMIIDLTISQLLKTDLDLKSDTKKALLMRQLGQEIMRRGVYQRQANCRSGLPMTGYVRERAYASYRSPACNLPSQAGRQRPVSYRNVSGRSAVEKAYNFEISKSKTEIMAFKRKDPAYKKRWIDHYREWIMEGFRSWHGIINYEEDGTLADQESDGVLSRNRPCGLYHEEEEDDDYQSLTS